MSVISEITALEEQLRQAELKPDPAFFETVIADEALLDGQRAKAQVVAAHQPGPQPKFTRVDMRDLEIIDHGAAAVVSCTGHYEGAQWSGSLKFMRVWLKRDGRWRIIAGTVSPA